eukprot:Colp12_sorted_trinity150504_noHs@30868
MQRVSKKGSLRPQERPSHRGYGTVPAEDLYQTSVQVPVVTTQQDFVPTSHAAQTKRKGLIDNKVVVLPNRQKDAPIDDDSEDITGRVTVFCTAKSYNFPELRRHLKENYQKFNYRHHEQPMLFQEAMYCHYVRGDASELTTPGGDLFYFDYGCIVMWGLTEAQERDVLYELIQFEQETLDKADVQHDEFLFHYNEKQQPRIYNDCININNKKDYLSKLAISYALSQSTKLFVFEEKINEIIESTKHVPVELAKSGTIKMSRIQLAKQIGHLFMQMCAINLVSNVLDTPDFLWEEPDELHALYTAVRAYLDIKKRVDVLNQRLMVVHGILGMLKDQSNHIHGEKLEWIVIWLIVAEILIGIAGIVVEAVFH